MLWNSHKYIANNKSFMRDVFHKKFTKTKFLQEASYRGESKNSCFRLTR